VQSIVPQHCLGAGEFARGLLLRFLASGRLLLLLAPLL
jgi:hypothetical protein